jgi:hypothetical protein
MLDAVNNIFLHTHRKGHPGSNVFRHDMYGVYRSRAGSKLVDRRLHDCAAASAGAPGVQNPFPPLLLPRSKIIQISFGILQLFLVLYGRGD